MYPVHMVWVMSSVGDRCKQVREKLQRSQQALANDVTRLGYPIGQSAIGNLESGHTQNPKFIVELAKALGVSTDWLRTGKEKSALVATTIAPVAFPDVGSMARDVPVLGTASGGSGQVHMQGGAIDYVRRPPPLAGRADVFALYIEEVSMVPAFSPGDLVFVEKRKPRVGDHAIIEYREDANDDPRCIIKKLAAVTATTVRLEQYNPSKILEIKLQHVIRMQRVMTMADLFGV